MSLLAIISTKEKTSAKDVICGSLQALPQDEQLLKLIDFFQVAADRNAQLAELISKAWNYLNANELWMVRYPSLQALCRLAQKLTHGWPTSSAILPR
jgi:hypothetical protein